MPESEAGIDAFISYSHVDRAFAVRLRDALGAVGKQAWLDESEIHGGTRWSDELQRAIQTADAFLFLFTPDSAESRECRAELAHALSLNKRILPLRVAETPIEDAPPGLADYQFIPGRQLFGADFDASLRQLITEIETDHDWVREHTDWSEKAVEWDQHHRERSYLLAGVELDAAEAWRSRAAGKRPGLSTLQSEFIDASRQWTTRRLRRTRAAVSVALVVAVALAALALVLRQQAVSAKQGANSGRLSADSLLQLTADPQLALLLSVQAARVKETPEALDALRSAIPANHLLRTVSANGEALSDAAWSPDGSMVATVSVDGDAYIYSASSGALLHRFAIGEAGTEGGGVRFLPGGRRLVAWINHGGVGVFDVATGARVVRLKDPSLDEVTEALPNPAGTVIAIAGGPGAGSAVVLFDAATGRRLRTLIRNIITDPRSPQPAAIPQSLSFSPDGRLLAGGSESGTATVWNAHTGAVVQTLHLASPGANQVYVFDLGFSPNGRYLATASADTSNIGQTVIWKVADWSSRTVNGVAPAWSPGSAFVATTGEQGTVRVYAAATGKTYAQFAANAPATEPVVIGPDVNGQLGNVLTPSQNGSVRVWSSYGGSVVETLAGDTGLVVGVGYSSEGSRILTWSGDGSARIWDAGQAATRPITVPRAVRALEGDESDRVLSQSFYEPAGLLTPLRAFTSYGNPFVRVVNVHSGATVVTIPHPAPSVSAASFDRAGRILALALATAKGEPLPAQIRSVQGGTLRRTLHGPGSLADWIVVSPDGRLVAAVDATGTIGVWDAATGRELTVFRGDVGPHGNPETGQVDLAFGPDSRLILSADMFGRDFVLQARTGRVLNRIAGMGEPPSGMFQGVGGAFSPDGRDIVVIRSWQNTATVYRVGQATPLTTLEGPALPIEGAAFNTDGSLIAAVAEDDTVRVWDTQHADPLLTVQLTTPGPQIAFTGDGQALDTTDEYSVPNETVSCSICGGFPQLLAAARQRETRGLSAQERATYLDSQ